MNLTGNEQLLNNINDMINSAGNISDIESVQSYIDSILSDARIDLENSFNPETALEDETLRSFVSKLESAKRTSIEKKNKLMTTATTENKDDNSDIEILDEDKEPTVKLPKVEDKKQQIEVLDEDDEPTIELPKVGVVEAAKKLANELQEVQEETKIVNYVFDEKIRKAREEKEQLLKDYNKMNEDAFTFNLYDDKQVLHKLTNMKDRLSELDKELDSLEGPKELSSERDIKAAFTNAKIEVKEIQSDKEIKKVENSKEKIELRNIKFIYEPSLNVWKISAETGLDTTYSKMYSVNKDLIFKNKNKNYDINIIKKYNLDNASNMDYTLADALEQFDKEFHTDLFERYATNVVDADIIYDLRDLFKTPKQMLTRKEKMQIMSNAKTQKENRSANVFYINTRKAKQTIGEPTKITPIQKAAIGTALGATVAAASFGAYSNSKNNNDNIEPEITNETVVSDDTDKKDADIIDISTSIQNNINTRNVIINTESDQIEDVSSEYDKKYFDAIENYNSVGIETEDLTFDESKDGIKLGDKLKLDNVTLSYDSNGSSPRANTDSLNFEYYKMCYVAILKDGKVMEVLDKNKIDELQNKSLEELTKKYSQKYGDDIKVQVNFNGYYDDTNYIKNQGWVDINDIKLKEEYSNSISR